MNLRLKKLILYLVNLIFTNFVIYTYLPLNLLGFLLISILVLIGTYLGIRVQEKLISPTKKLLIDIGISFSVAFFYLLITFILLTFEISSHDPKVTLWSAFLMNFIFISIGLIYSTIAWLPWGIINFFLIKRLS